MRAAETGSISDKRSVGHLSKIASRFLVLPLLAVTMLMVPVLCPAQSSRRAITINTVPNARIWIEGVLYGTTSEAGILAINTVAPGRKTIRVRADGFKEAQKVLLPNQKGPIAIPLAKTADEAELAFQNAERLSVIDREKAAAAYQMAIRLRPGYVDAHIGLARLYLDAREYEKAEKAIAAARRVKPGLAEISAIEGRVFRSAEDDENAIGSFKRAIREGRGFQPEAYAGLGLLYKEMAENAGASGDFEKEAVNYDLSALNLSAAIKQLSGAPDSVVLYQFLGMIYEDQKKFDKAIAVYQEFLDLFPGHPESDTFRSFIVQLKKQAGESRPPS